MAATQTTNPARAVLFGYETGTTMVGVTAPARRVGLPLNTTTTTRRNATGWKLIEGAIGWAVPEIRYLRDATDRIVARSIGGTVVERYGFHRRRRQPRPRPRRDRRRPRTELRVARWGRAHEAHGPGRRVGLT
ncbi:MAG: hypothetical protein ACT4OX_13315 [Actinomycetota bacterium]